MKLIRVLKGERVNPPPVWLMRQAGRYLPEYRAVREKAGGFLDLCYSPEMAAEVTLQPIERFDFDAAILFSDILVVPDALGCDVRFVEGEGPVLLPIDGETWRGLDFTDVPSRLAPVYEAVRQIRARLDPGKALIGFAGAPWTVATYMVEGGASKDYAHLKRWMWTDPDGFGVFLYKLADAIADHLIAQIEAGADCVQLFDSWAGVLPEQEFSLWSAEPVYRIIGKIRERHPDVPVIAFPRGAGAGADFFARVSEANAIGMDQFMRLEQGTALQKQGVVVQGNLDPILLTVGGPVMERTVKYILDGLAGGPHVFNLGHGIVPQTPPENVAELVRLVRAWEPPA